MPVQTSRTIILILFIYFILFFAGNLWISFLRKVLKCWHIKSSMGFKCNRLCLQPRHSRSLFNCREPSHLQYLLVGCRSLRHSCSSSRISGFLQRTAGRRGVFVVHSPREQLTRGCLRLCCGWLEKRQNNCICVSFLLEPRAAVGAGWQKRCCNSWLFSPSLSQSSSARRAADGWSIRTGHQTGNLAVYHFLLVATWGTAEKQSFRPETHYFLLIRQDKKIFLSFSLLLMLLIDFKSQNKWHKIVQFPREVIVPYVLPCLSSS